MIETVGGTAVTFLREYFRGTKGPLCITVLRNTKSKLSKKSELDKLLTRKPGEINKFLVDHDKPEQECGIYYCTATLKDGATSRAAEHCLQFPSLFADVDDKNHVLTRAAAAEALEELELPPTLIVDSGHGLQPHWLLSEPCEDAARIIAARKKLQRLVASDEVHDAPRLMRLPGSHNSKNGDWITAQVVSQHTERRYPLEALEEWLNHAKVAIPSKPKEKPTGNGAVHGKPFIVPSAGTGTDHKRGTAWAAKALQESGRELADTGEGSRHNMLRDKSVRMGTMVARGWVDTVTVQRALRAAAETCGLIKDKGIGEFEQTFADGIKHGMAMPHPDLPNDSPPHSGNGAAFEKPHGDQQSEPGIAENNKTGDRGGEQARKEQPEPDIDLAATFSFLGDAPAAPPRELIKNHLPASGVVITGGQSGAGKTFISIHKAICLATGMPYFGHKIVERVGTAYIAAEGRGSINNRFAAALAKHSITDNLPIAWIRQLPDFASADGIKLFIRQMKALDEQFRGDFGLRLGHITLDTVAAGFAMKSEDDNSEATGVCNIMRRIGEDTEALFNAVHHYGKNPESGLRGASAWKGSADVIEGVLADIDPLSGKASNRELVCTKSRDGEQGPMSAFELQFVELGLDEDNEIYGSCCVVAGEGESRFDKTATPNKAQRAISAAIHEVLNGIGQIIVPRADMAPIKAAKVIDVRKEFDRFYVVDEADPIKAADAKRKAFKRALDKLPLSQFGYGSAEGADWIWSLK